MTARFVRSRIRARRREWRWQSQQNAAHRPPRFSKIATFRVAELERLFAERYGPVLPNDDAGRDDLAILLNHLALTRGNVLAKMLAAVTRWAPWFPGTEAKKLAKRIAKRPSIWTADALAAKVRLTDAERTALNICTIGAVDVSKAQRAARRKERKVERDREYRRARRRREGAKAQSASISRSKPWEAEGISRRTWYRRRAGTSASSPNECNELQGDETVPPDFRSSR